MLLSICVPTYNRGGFIGDMLASVVPQLQEGVEIIIVDGASTDNTPAVVIAFAEGNDAIRYIREERNSGFDADLDKAVGYARGEYCWLMSDDDVLALGAIERVIRVLRARDIELLVVDIEIRDISLSNTLLCRRMAFDGMREYGERDGDAILTDLGAPLGFFGGTIVRKQFWITRDRSNYFGTLFVHFGVIFQDPVVGPAKAIAEPLVILRAGNSAWTPRRFEIWAFIWPELVWSFDALSEKARRSVTPFEPWRGLVWLMGYRAFGAYSLREYRAHFEQRNLGAFKLCLFLMAIAPGRALNFFGILFYAITGRARDPLIYELAACSRFSTRLSRAILYPWLGRIKRPFGERAVR